MEYVATFEIVDKTNFFEQGLSQRLLVRPLCSTIVNMNGLGTNKFEIFLHIFRGLGHSDLHETP